jgi:hypothetical protein
VPLAITYLMGSARQSLAGHVHLDGRHDQCSHALHDLRGYRNSVSWLISCRALT